MIICVFVKNAILMHVFNIHFATLEEGGVNVRSVDRTLGVDEFISLVHQRCVHTNLIFNLLIVTFILLHISLQVEVLEIVLR